MSLLHRAIRLILNDDEVPICSPVGEVTSEEVFMERVKINNDIPTLAWSEVQAKMDELRILWALNKLREQRNDKLKQTDPYVLPDYPHVSDEIRQAWLDYRQQLRDLPANSPDAQLDLETGKLVNVEWPTEPIE